MKKNYCSGISTTKAIVIGVVIIVIVAAGWMLLSSPGGNVQLPGMSGTGQPSGSNNAGTEIIKFIPTLPAEEKSGDCWASSLVAPGRTDAWQCNIEEQEFTYDPCFSVPNQDTVVCGANPLAEETGFAVLLKKPLPQPDIKTPMAAWGWLVALKDGAVCGPLGSANLSLEGKPVTYGCKRLQGNDSIVILGDLNSSKAVWTAEVATISVESGAPKIGKKETIDITRVWQ